MTNDTAHAAPQPLAQSHNTTRTGGLPRTADIKGVYQTQARFPRWNSQLFPC